MPYPCDVERYMKWLDEYLALAEKQRRKKVHDPVIHEQKKNLLHNMISFNQSYTDPRQFDG